MGRTRKLFLLPRAEKWLVLKAWALVCVVRLGLWTLPYRRLLHLQQRATRNPPARLRRQTISPERIAWAVRAASQLVPGARHCLTQALATQTLLARRGIPAELRFGVARDADNGISAHAWVESNGVVLIGDTDLERYAPLTRREDRGS